jgi:hypothetical protein
MARLIEIEHVQKVHSNLTLEVGDVVLFKATGGHVQSGAEAVEMVGMFNPAVVGDNGRIFSPLGAPNTVLFRALRAGMAVVDVVTGDPWGPRQVTVLNITVGS